MNSRFFHLHLARWLMVLSLLGFGMAAMAQSEPSLNQVYAAAQAGKLDEAQGMVQQVLIAHPQSAKAFYVRAELYARQGKLPLAREAFATAERLAPGLPFAKPDAVQALRTELQSRSGSPAAGGTTTTVAAPAATASRSPSWGFLLLIAGGVIAAGYFLFRNKAPQGAALRSDPSYANMNGLNGPQSFGMGGAPLQSSYPPSGYAPQAGTGMGGRIMGGVATGLAVGAGVMAAEAIGRNLMGNHADRSGPSWDNSSGNDYQPISSNSDMGGDNFGVNDGSSWDDGGADMGGGSDWDN
jgi:hypothetical protein